MKFCEVGFVTSRKDVAPLAGAWIEIMSNVNISCVSAVAPLAGAWIEMTKNAIG